MVLRALIAVSLVLALGAGGSSSSTLPLEPSPGRVTMPSRPKSVAVGDLALFTHGRAHRRVTVVDPNPPSSPTVIGRLSVPGPAYDVTDQPDSANAYFTNRNRGGVGAIDYDGRIRWWRRVGAYSRSATFDYYQGRRLWVTDSTRGDVLGLAGQNGAAAATPAGLPWSGRCGAGG
jgi:hypothetical protein